jgi:hypothetical protein
VYVFRSADSWRMLSHPLKPKKNHQDLSQFSKALLRNSGADFTNPPPLELSSGLDELSFEGYSDELRSPSADWLILI